MGLRTLLLLIGVFISFVNSAEVNYIKTEVYLSSWIPSQTLEKIRQPKECSRLCQVAYDCTAFRHDRCTRICELGQKKDLVSASQPGKDTTTVLVQPANWKLLVANDYRTPPVTTVEIINFKTNDSVCSKIPNFPKIVRGSMGGLVDKTTPMICGGVETPKLCYKLESGIWQPSEPILQRRCHFAGMPFSPFKNSSHKFFIVGGGWNALTTEVLTDSGWESTSIVIPNDFYMPCMTLPSLDENSFLLVGRFNSTQTLVFDTTKLLWSRGPDLLYGRYGPTCGRLPTKEKSSLFSIIVVGGQIGGAVSDSVEILDSLAMGWRVGPKLPKPCFAAPMVGHPNGGVIYIIETSIFYLAHAGPSAQWQLLPQKLAVARLFFLAFFVPDEVASCT